jgi:predicted unusual protein kinase regulating ubiquinone biosynthesis (AarF/ABC1/UbiB family)
MASNPKDRHSIKDRGRTRAVAGLAARVGASYGKSMLARALGLTAQESVSLTHEKNAARILETAIALRGPFMKLVQFLSFQGEILPEQYLDALSTVQDKAPPLSWRDVQPVLESEFRCPPEKLFRSIKTEPIAAASLGQVYEGMLPDGTPVAIKVQYPGVREAVKKDLRVFRRMMKAQKFVGSGLLRNTGYDYDQLVGDLSERLHEELDYGREAANIELFRRIYRDVDYVDVPRVYREFSTDRVLTMDLLPGTSLAKVIRPETPLPFREQLSFRLVEMLNHELLGVGVMHADPHPGNKLIVPDGRISLVDFGCIKVLPRSLRDASLAGIRALIDGDDARIVNALRDLGLYRDGLDPAPAIAWWKFAYYPITIDRPYDPAELNWGAEIFQRVGELARAGYIHFAPHSAFLLRVYYGGAAVLRGLRVTTLNERRRFIDFLSNRLASGQRIRDELERDGLVRCDV